MVNLSGLNFTDTAVPLPVPLVRGVVCCLNLGAFFTRGSFLLPGGLLGVALCCLVFERLNECAVQPAFNMSENHSVYSILCKSLKHK